METADEQLKNAIRLFDAGRLPESEAIFRTLTSSPAQASDAYYGLALIRMRGGDLRSAEELLLASSRLNPRNANSYFYLGSLAEQQDQADKSRGYYEKCLAADPTHQGALKKIGPRAVTNPPPPSSLLSSFLKLVDPQDEGDHKHGFAALLAEDQSSTAKQAVKLIAAVDREVTPHVSAFLGNLLTRVIVGLLVAPFFILILEGSGVQKNMDMFTAVMVLGLVAVITLPLITFLRIKSTKLQLSRGRVKLSSGILSKTVTNAELYRVKDVALHRSLINRITGDGSITLKLDGHLRSKTVKLKGIARGAELEKLFENLRDLILILRSGTWGKGVIY